MTVILERAVQSSSISFPIMKTFFPLSFSCSDFYLLWELKDHFSISVITPLSGTYLGTKASDEGGCMLSLFSAILRSALENLPPQTLYLKPSLCLGSPFHGTTGYKTALGFRGAYRREKATWLQMATDSSKFKMTVKDLAGGQLFACREVGGAILLIQSTENESNKS